MNEQFVQECEEYKAKRVSGVSFHRKAFDEFLAFSDVLDTLGIRGTVPASYPCR